MGQTIVVTMKPGARPEVRHFDTNRSITGMAIERYRAGVEITRHRPPDVLAREVLDLGATSVTIYSNVVTVEAPAASWADIGDDVEEAIRELFIYYREGVAVADPMAGLGA